MFRIYRARRREFCRPSLLPSCKFFWKNIAWNGQSQFLNCPQWKYPLFGLEFEKLIWPVLFANIDLNWPHTFWGPTYCDSKGQSISLWRSHWSNIWCWTTSLWTHCRCRAEQRVQVLKNISKFIWRQNCTSQIEKCHFQRIEKFETHEECDCIRQANKGFIQLSLPHRLECFFRGKMN